MDRECTRLAAKGLGYKLVRGKSKPCEVCVAGKAKQKNVTKSSGHVPAQEKCGGIFLDISTIKSPKDIKVSVTKLHWMIMMDKRIGLKLSYFFQEKNGMIDPTCVQSRKWRIVGQPVRLVRSNNDGDNFKLEQVANGKDWKMDINFGYTGAGTPHRNPLAELGFTVIGARVRALMYHTNLKTNIRYRVYKEVYRNAAMFDGLTVTDIDGKQATRYEHFAAAAQRLQ